jgi:3'(2'), 5'-bisphosphate nucleotidase
LRVAGSRSHPDPRTQALLERLGPHELVSLGSALKFVRLAAGEIDLYVRYGPTSEWDTAAGQCLIEAVGGSVTNLAGEPLRYNQRDSLLNPDFVASIDRSRDWLQYV